MPLSPVQKADRYARSRGLLMAVGAVVLLALAALNAFGIPRDTSDPTRGIGWAVLILLWLLVLATGGGLMLNRQVRRMMNDEVSTHNRRRAIETGFWVAMAAAAALYFASFGLPFDLRGGLALLTEVAIAAALLRYAWLELH